MRNTTRGTLQEDAELKKQRNEIDKLQHKISNLNKKEYHQTFVESGENELISDKPGLEQEIRVQM
jgi:enoyl-[acyl-carrier-protein] reductase (NADH)